jgi:TRAP-type C4-dicarboxylate transport system permease small subunit
MELFKLLKKVLRLYDKFIYYLLTLLLGFIAAVLFLNVIFRYFLYAAFPWAEELTLFLMIWMAGLAARPALKLGDFIKIDSLQVWLSTSKPLLVLGIKSVILLAIFVYLSVVVVSGIKLCLHVLGQTSPMLQISMAIPYSAMPYGAFFMILTALEELVETLTHKDKGHEV